MLQETRPRKTSQTVRAQPQRRATPIWVWRVVALAAFGLLWEFLAASGMINTLFFGQPSGIAVAFFEGLFVDQTLVKDLVWTLAATIAAFVLGSCAGILAGLLFVVYPKAEEFWEPIMSALNALPRIALAPLFLLWFGLGITSKIALGFSLTFFIVLSSTVAGARSVDLDLVRLAQTLGATPTQIFRRITLISAIPTIFSGLRLGLIYALLGVIAGEIIAAQHGLGQRLTFLAGTFQINGVFAVLLILGLLGSVLTRTMSIVEARLLTWR